MIHSIALLLAVLLVVAAILIFATAFLLAETILRPPRMTDAKAVYILKRLSPADLDLQYSDLKFEIRDHAYPSGPSIELAAWWMPAAVPSEKCVVLLHGYADAKVGVIAWAPLWHALGFNALAIDLRAHGESGGLDSTAGFFERHDLSELIDRLRTMHPRETNRLALFGVSMGAAVALGTAAMRDDLAAVVIDSPFADFRYAVQTHLDRAGMPIGIISHLAIRFAEMISRAKFAAVRPLKLLTQINCPIMLIRSTRDRFILDVDARAMDEMIASKQRNTVWIVDNADHLGALHAAPNEYARRIDEFLKTAGV